MLKKVSNNNRSFDFLVFHNVLSSLEKGEVLDKKYDDHPLIGNWAGWRECHLAYDLLLIYKLDNKNNELILSAIGTHSQLYG